MCLLKILCKPEKLYNISNTFVTLNKNIWKKSKSVNKLNFHFFLLHYLLLIFFFFSFYYKQTFFTNIFVYPNKYFKKKKNIFNFLVYLTTQIATKLNWNWDITPKPKMWHNSKLILWPNSNCDHITSNKTIKKSQIETKTLKIESW